MPAHRSSFNGQKERQSVFSGLHKDDAGLDLKSFFLYMSRVFGRSHLAAPRTKIYAFKLSRS